MQLLVQKRSKRVNRWGSKISFLLGWHLFWIEQLGDKLRSFTSCSNVWAWTWTKLFILGKSSRLPNLIPVTGITSRLCTYDFLRMAKIPPIIPWSFDHRLEDAVVSDIKQAGGEAHPGRFEDAICSYFGGIPHPRCQWKNIFVHFYEGPPN